MLYRVWNFANQFERSVEVMKTFKQENSVFEDLVSYILCLAAESTIEMVASYSHLEQEENCITSGMG